MLEICLRTVRAERLIDRALVAEESLHAPYLLDIEIAQALRRLVLAKALTAKRATQALEDFAQMRVERHEHQPLLSRVWDLRNAVTAYDGAYVALAEALAAPLLTCDTRLSGAHGHKARIELVV